MIHFFRVVRRGEGQADFGDLFKQALLVNIVIHSTLDVLSFYHPSQRLRSLFANIQHLIADLIEDNRRTGQLSKQLVTTKHIVVRTWATAISITLLSTTIQTRLDPVSTNRRSSHATMVALESLGHRGNNPLMHVSLAKVKAKRRK
jgi:hypothetical protein